MAKYFAGGLIRMPSGGHFVENEDLPDSVEKLSNFDECIKSGLIKKNSGQVQVAGDAKKTDAK